jgi:quinol monooxygenase YgiN
MAVGIRVKFAGVTQEQFDAVNALIDPDSNPPKGLLFHASGPVDDGWGVIDFWESRAAFDEFQQSRIQPAVAASGYEMQGPPDIKEFPVHETFPR